MDTCGMKTTKYLLFSFNLVFAVCGIGIITAGAFVLGYTGEYNHFMESKANGPPIVLIIAGTIVFIIAFMGCFGAIKEQRGLLLAFGGCLIIIFIVELAVAIAAAAYRGDLHDVLKTTLVDSMKNYSTVDKQAWDDLQTKLLCCGVDGPQDWSPANGFQGPFPGSCCKEQKDSCQSGSPTVYLRGCLRALEHYLQKSTRILIGAGVGVALIEIAGIILSCSLAHAIKKQNSK